MIYTFFWEQPGNWRHGYGGWREYPDGTIYRIFGKSSIEEVERLLEES